MSGFQSMESHAKKSLHKAFSKEDSVGDCFLQKEAEEGDMLAEAYLGLRMINTNVSKATEYVRRTFSFLLAESDHCKYAQFILGTLYETGFYVIKDVKKAAQFQMKASHRDLPAAQFRLAKYYSSGFGVPKVVSKAALFFRIAADGGHLKAQLHIGQFYLLGTGVEKNEKEAVRYFQQAADQGSPNAHYNLGMFYANGTGVAQNAQQGMVHLRFAAEHGYAPAQFQLGKRYQLGKDIEKNLSEAWNCEKLAAEQGYAKAQTLLGTYLTRGIGCAVDDAEAVRYYKLAAAQGQAEAQMNLGLSYRTGKGVTMNFQEAVRYFQLAANQGNVGAQRNLDICMRSQASAAGGGVGGALEATSSSSYIGDGTGCGCGGVNDGCASGIRRQGADSSDGMQVNTGAGVELQISPVFQPAHAVQVVQVAGPSSETASTSTYVALLGTSAAQVLPPSPAQLAVQVAAESSAPPSLAPAEASSSAASTRTSPWAAAAFKRFAKSRQEEAKSLLGPYGADDAGTVLDLLKTMWTMVDPEVRAHFELDPPLPPPSVSALPPQQPQFVLAPTVGKKRKHPLGRQQAKPSMRRTFHIDASGRGSFAPRPALAKAFRM